MDTNRKNKIVAYWLLTGIFMIIVQVLLGGVTRLTGSGLSITEWKPIMGALPPMGESEWQAAFQKYQGIAQYKYLNNHFTLGDFKFIFFWEWFHRLWARFLGVVFAIPFIYFIVKRYFSKDMVIPLVILFILGGAQGLIGWIMVDSGLNDTNLYVNHIKLSIHFISALVLLCYTLWFALKLLVPARDIVRDKPLHNFLLGAIVLLTVQLIYGAFMAGLKAAMAAATWPTINGDWIPAGLGSNSWINHPINVHFVHRGLAYILFVVVIAGFVKVSRVARQTGSATLLRSARYPLVLVCLQVLLGIFTVISAPKIVPGHFGLFEILAEAHQLVAMFLLIALTVQLFLVRSKGAGSLA
ncbi:COX15/CtaA family protein [Taibaiella chishuiensis]|uniref:Cytochrome c oxidase assembly protein subunit 15 n=1 Tax=Taibaiella chishuiensis TaxID=1434707 RepID=A0A2P8D4L5_9BACT|nr:COX15/CtaA family protein [Taibaiella chishuiensis]PSK92153.1 cytochrome c oxidase assembly protein subunit 15 [Taibaiella chishuiensis]